MAIRGYLSKWHEIRRPRPDLELPIRWSGDVLEGRVSLDCAFLRDGAQVKIVERPNLDVGEYDPVLRSVCRLDKEG